MCEFRFNIGLLIFPGLIFRESRNLLWCPVFKAASTNWMQNIMLLANLSKRQIAQLEKQYKQYVMWDFTEIIISILFLRQPNQQARQAAPFIKKKKIKTIENDESSVRFIVTRHPFHRFIKKIVWFLYFLNFQPQTFVSLQRQIGEMHTRFWLHKEKWLVKNDLF